MCYTFKVEDMTCGGCAASIKQAVSRVPGVSGVDANPSSKDVVVNVSADVSRETNDHRLGPCSLDCMSPSFAPPAAAMPGRCGRYRTKLVSGRALASRSSFL